MGNNRPLGGISSSASRSATSHQPQVDYLPLTACFIPCVSNNILAIYHRTYIRPHYDQTLFIHLPGFSLLKIEPKGLVKHSNNYKHLKKPQYKPVCHLQALKRVVMMAVLSCCVQGVLGNLGFYGLKILGMCLQVCIRGL